MKKLFIVLALLVSTGLFAQNNLISGTSAKFRDSLRLGTARIIPNASKIGINKTGADSTLDIFGSLKVSGGIALTGIPSAKKGKQVYYDPATKALSYGDTTIPSGGGASQNLQQTLSNGSTLSGNNTINVGANTLRFNGANGSYISRTNDEVKIKVDSTKDEVVLLNIDPPTYNPDHVPFRFNIGSTAMPPYTGKNVVATWGWNISPGGGLVVPGQPAIGFSLESNYHPDGTGAPRWVESHEFYIKPNGEQVRLKSYTIGVTGTPFVQLYHKVNEFALETTSTIPTQYLRITGDSGNPASLGLANSLGRSVVLSVSASQVGLQPYGGSADLLATGFKRMNMPGNKIYIDSADGMAILGSDVLATGYSTLSGFEFVEGKTISGNNGYFSGNMGAGHLQWRPQGNIDITNNKDSVMKIAFIQHDHNFNPITKLLYGGNMIFGLNVSSTVEPSAILQLNDTARGFLPTRMTKAQRDAIPSPATGLVIYQRNNTPGLRCFNGSSWMRFTETAD